MRMHRLGLAALILACALPATHVVAGDVPVEKAVVADSADKFATVAETIRNEMKPEGRYEFIKDRERSEVERGLDGMAALLGKSGSVAAMNREEQVQLFNLQERVNGILTKSDSSRLVCERRAPVGSNIPQTKCATYGEIERARVKTQNDLQRKGVDSTVCNVSKLCRGN